MLLGLWHCQWTYADFQQLSTCPFLSSPTASSFPTERFPGSLPITRLTVVTYWCLSGNRGPWNICLACQRPSSPAWGLTEVIPLNCVFSCFQWMRARWTSDPCYAFFGVDGTECSFLIYLSEVEWFCPPLPWRNQTAALPSPKPLPKAQVRSVQACESGQHHLLGVFLWGLLDSVST